MRLLEIGLGLQNRKTSRSRDSFWASEIIRTLNVGLSGPMLLVNGYQYLLIDILLLLSFSK